MGRRRKNPIRSSWRKKLPPVFFELAELNKDFEERWAQLQDKWTREFKRVGSAERARRSKLEALVAREREQLEQWFDTQLVEINNRHSPMPYNPIAYSYFTLDPPVHDSQGIREYIHFHRHGESLRVTQNRDAEGELKAWDKISRTERDIRIVAFGKGRLKPFQGDLVHRQLLQLVICFETERLSAEELVSCFDTYCDCGKESHDPDALRKMRDRLEAELNAR